GALDGLEDRRGGLGVVAGVVLQGPAARLGEGCAQAGDRLAVALGALALLLDLAEQVLAVRPDRFELAEQRLVRREPVVRRLAGGGLGRRLLRLLAALGEACLGVGGAGL